MHRGCIIIKPVKTEDLSLLIRAILTRAQEQGGYVTKTKLFKYLYLIDIEYFRQKRALLTGFAWKFYHYGPWCQECEDLYQYLRNYDDIELSPGGTSVDLDIEFI